MTNVKRCRRAHATGASTTPPLPPHPPHHARLPLFSLPCPCPKSPHDPPEAPCTPAPALPPQHPRTLPASSPPPPPPRVPASTTPRRHNPETRVDGVVVARRPAGQQSRDALPRCWLRSGGVRLWPGKRRGSVVNKKKERQTAVSLTTPCVWGEVCAPPPPTDTLTLPTLPTPHTTSPTPQGPPPPPHPPRRGVAETGAPAAGAPGGEARSGRSWGKGRASCPASVRPSATPPPCPPPPPPSISLAGRRPSRDGEAGAGGERRSGRIDVHDRLPLQPACRPLRPPFPPPLGAPP